MTELGKTYNATRVCWFCELLLIIAFCSGLACGDFKTMLCGRRLREVVHCYWCMFVHCRITRAPAMPATRASTVRLILMSVCYCRAKTTPPAGSARTKLVLTSAMSMRQASTVTVFLDSLVLLVLLHSVLIISIISIIIEKCFLGCLMQGDHLSGKHGNVREFGTCEGNVRDVVNSQAIVREMSGKKSCHGKVSQNCSLLDEY